MTTVDKSKLETDIQEIENAISDLMGYSYEVGFYSRSLEAVPNMSDQWYVSEGLRRESAQNRVYARQNLVRLYKNLTREVVRLGKIIDQFGA